MPSSTGSGKKDMLLRHAENMVWTLPSMFYRCKEAFDAYGVDGLRSRTRRPDPGLRRLKKENDRMKKMLAERELEVSMLQEAYKKPKDSDPDE